MSYGLGVDLGTTYAAAAVLRDGEASVVGLGNRASAVPSVVFLADDGTVLVGEAASRRAVAEPERVAREFKRRLGDPTPLLLGGSPHSAEQLMAHQLRWIVDRVTELEGGPPTALAVTHPANWGPYKQDLLAQAVRLADLDLTATLTEPEAAAIAYAANERVDPGAVVAVYDLGGGTFDAAVLRKEDAGFSVLGEPEGIERLGGIDFDEAVFRHVTDALADQVAALDVDDPTVLAGLARLRHECNEAKEALSADTDASIPIVLPGVHTEVRLTRGELEAMVRPTLSDTVGALRRALQSAGVAADEVHAVLLVGGSSRIPLIAQLVSAELQRPVAVDAHPKHSIALGAARSLGFDDDNERGAVAAAALAAAGAGLAGAAAAVTAGEEASPTETADVAAAATPDAPAADAVGLDAAGLAAAEDPTAELAGADATGSRTDHDAAAEDPETADTVALAARTTAPSDSAGEAGDPAAPRGRRGRLVLTLLAVVVLVLAGGALVLAQVGSQPSAPDDDQPDLVDAPEDDDDDAEPGDEADEDTPGAGSGDDADPGAPAEGSEEVDRGTSPSDDGDGERADDTGDPDPGADPSTDLDAEPDPATEPDPEPADTAIDEDNDQP